MKKLIVLLSFFHISCGSSWNFYADFGDKESKDAMLEEAKFRIDEGNYTGAIELLDILATNFPTDSQIAIQRSSAYAGAGGVGLLDTATSMLDLEIDTNIANAPLAGYLVLVQEPTDLELSYTLEAINSLTSFASASARTNEMNMYLSVIAYASVATVLSARADINPSDNTVDNGIACSTFSDDDILNIIYIYSVAKQSVTETNGSSTWLDVQDQILNFTDAVELLGVNLDVTSKSQITDSECETLKSFVIGGLTGNFAICTCDL